MVDRAEFSSIRHRIEPTQIRALETVRRILEASSKLLIEQGLPQFNTNAVAKASGVNISTLYRYFPDKNAILLDLYAGRVEVGTRLVQARMDQFAEASSIRDFYSSFLRKLLELQDINPIGPILHQVNQVLPDLRGTEVEFVRTLVGISADGYQKRFPHLSQARCLVAASTVYMITMALLDAARDEAFLNIEELEEETITVVTLFLESLQIENNNPH